MANLKETEPRLEDLQSQKFYASKRT